VAKARQQNKKGPFVNDEVFFLLTAPLMGGPFLTLFSQITFNIRGFTDKSG
jgi:hypothetical protein